MEKQGKPHRSDRSLVGILLAALLAACSSDKPAPADDNSACNSLLNDGPTIGFAVQPGSNPTATAGTIVDGTYELSQANVYFAPAGYSNSSMLSAVFQISGNTIQQVGSIDGEERRYTSSYSINGVTLSTTDTCPEPSSDSFAYTATPTELHILQASGGITLQQIFTKR